VDILLFLVFYAMQRAWLKAVLIFGGFGRGSVIATAGAPGH